MLSFTDDFAIIDNNYRDLGHLLKSMDKTFKKVLNMKINIQKQKFYCINK